MEYTVYIPTRGRTGESTQITLRDLKQYSSIKPWIVCPEQELRAHRFYHDQVLVSPIEGIAEKRQWILENCPTQGAIMLDDDLYFSYRPEPATPRPLERVRDLDPMFQWMSNQLDAGFMHGGISARQGNQNVEREFLDCTRCMNVHYFDVQQYRRLGIRFDMLRVMEDFYVTLSLLTLGFPNRVGYQWCWNQRGGGTRGGCSLYRTAELQAESANKLAEFFPGYVKVVEKESQSQSGVMAKRVDVNVAWLKAWNEEGVHHHKTWLAEGVYKPGIPDLRRR